MGIVKSTLSTIAYVPQFVLIYRNKSTKGWSIKATATDTIGSGIGVTQVIVDYFNWAYPKNFFETLNYGKFCLNLVSLLFTFILYFQHFCLYYENSKSCRESRMLNLDDKIEVLDVKKKSGIFMSFQD